MAILRTLSRRDTILIFLGALCMHAFSTLFNFESNSSIVINTHLGQYQNSPDLEPLPPPPEPPVTTRLEINFDEPLNIPPPPPPPPPQVSVPIDIATTLPETTIVSHAPGWTIFRDIYMADGTFYIVTSKPRSQFPDVRMMTSVSLFAYATPENIAAREPTNQEMDFLTPQEAMRTWGGDVELGHKNRIWSVEGNTILFNDPNQFLNHYYHFVAELLLGAWAFWSGSFAQTTFTPNALPRTPPLTSIGLSEPLPVDRFIFAHSTAEGWRDGPGFNAYFLRAAFPSVTVETEHDWHDRIATTPKSRAGSRAWHFPVLFIADRSAAFRGQACGHRTQRTAAEAYEAMMTKGTLKRDWWEPIRQSVYRFAGGKIAGDGGGTSVAVKGAKKPETADRAELLPMPERVVITYISRQNSKRHLVDEDHEGLVLALEDLVDRKGWHLNVVEAEHLTKDEQVRLMGETTIMLGVHGNGLTHLVLMPPTRVSAVIEIFIPGGFAHDYEWTTRALGMRHIAVWNDTYHTHPDEVQVDYPEGFQGMQIPVYGPTVAQVIEDRIEGRL